MREKILGFIVTLLIVIISLYSMSYLNKYSTVYYMGQHSIENVWRIIFLVGIFIIVVQFGHSLFQKKVETMCIFVVILLCFFSINIIFFDEISSTWLHHPKLKSVNDNYFYVEKEKVVYKVYCKESECAMLKYMDKKNGNISTMEIRLIGDKEGILERIVIY